MIMEFKTPINRNGNSKYLAFDTGAMIYTTNCRRMIATGYKVPVTVYREIIEQLKKNEYKQVDYI